MANRFPLVTVASHEVDFHRDGIYFDPISFSFDKGACYTLKLTFDKPYVGSTPIES
jgi:hypothetical protein